MLTDPELECYYPAKVRREPDICSQSNGCCAVAIMAPVQQFSARIQQVFEQAVRSL